ncbi:hypothetical protein Q8A67_021877 [Cirrhinus molitorella]|uniref:Myeloid-associated differentiation marker-like protein 2 n=1 Tax=Cirrhinus molitorella TaxID=172907 RepID=A0AA88P4D5_9TELE|nr:hypothetical protein Q8A67_021877 [Cirrhinus molitorella]
MSASAGHHLNVSAVFSPVGASRVCQLTLGCAVISLVIHGAGYSATYGTFCMTVWTSCFAISAAILVLDVTRLHTCLPVSWENLAVTFASLAFLLTLTASIMYPVFFVRVDDCPYNNCEVRNFRIAVSVCSWAACVAYGTEVFLSRAKPGKGGHVVSYMATSSGVLKVVQCYMGCVILVTLTSGTDFSRHAATLYCAVVFGVCLMGSVLLVSLVVSGRTAALRLPLERVAVIYTFAATLLYVSAAVLWPVFCFDRKYGDPLRPQGCPRGKCSWDAKLAVAVMSFINLALYISDLICSHRSRPATQQRLRL